HKTILRETISHYEPDLPTKGRIGDGGVKLLQHILCAESSGRPNEAFLIFILRSMGCPGASDLGLAQFGLRVAWVEESEVADRLATNLVKGGCRQFASLARLFRVNHYDPFRRLGQAKEIGDFRRSNIVTYKNVRYPPSVFKDLSLV